MLCVFSNLYFHFLIHYALFIGHSDDISFFMLLNQPIIKAILYLFNMSDKMGMVQLPLFNPYLSFQILPPVLTYFNNNLFNSTLFYHYLSFCTDCARKNVFF